MPESTSPINTSSSARFRLKCAFHFFKIIGLLPIAVTFINGSEEVEVSRVGYLYNIFLIILIFTLDFFSIPYTSEVQYIGDSALTRRLKLAKAIIGTIILFLTWFIMCVRLKVLVDIVNRFIGYDRELMRYSHIHRMKTSTSLLIAIFVSNVLIWTGVTITDVLISRYFGMNVVYWVALIIPSFVVSWLLIQYTMVLSLLTLRFEHVNGMIAELSPRDASIQQDYLEMPHERIPLNRFTVGTLLAIKRLHANYHEVTNDIADFYAVPLLINVTFFCGTIIYSAYYLIIPLIMSSWGDSLALSSSNAVLMLAMQLFPIVTMAISVNRLTNEMNLTADAVHKLLARAAPSREVKSELKRFSLELLHRNVEFTAHGVFPLDCTLVHSILSIAVTYLIILVQFQKTSDS